MPSPNKRPRRYQADRLETTGIDEAVVREWWAPRMGTANPERLNNLLWEWLVRTRINAYEARKRFGFPSPWDDDRPGPAWCFARMGQSVTALPDGRVVMIAGEHEDGYDPDFRIYNDVTIQHPDGSLDLFGYPEEVFPPTDFHSATLAGNRIILIGSIGYDCQGSAGQSTQVLELQLETWALRKITCSGESPGWLHNHLAELNPDGSAITIRGGLVVPEADSFRGFRENPDHWKLDLETWEWTRLTLRPWVSFIFHSSGMQRFPLFELRSLPWAVDYGAGMPADSDALTEDNIPPPLRDHFQKHFGTANAYARTAAARLYQQGVTPDLDLIRGLYSPAVAHEVLSEPEEESGEEEPWDPEGPFEPDEDDYSRWGEDFEGERILVQGVTVRFQEIREWPAMVIEGDLPDETVQVLTEEFAGKLQRLMNVPVTVERL